MRSFYVGLQAEHDAVRLSNLAYGVDGNFAINLWMRRNSDSDLSGDTFQYLYHHSGIAAAPGYSPNQIAIYVTDRCVIVTSHDYQSVYSTWQYMPWVFCLLLLFFCTAACAYLN
jgi:hypothetical protein